jgi:plasmid stabilization system protein ParE
MKIRILPNAETDLELGADFYESQRAGLGEYFLTSLISDVESLKLYGGIHEQYFGFHRSVSKRFPFAIYYRLRENTVQIYAVLDCRQNPKKIDKRLQDENA